MMNLLPGDIVLADVSYSAARGSKRRPVVVALDTGDDDFVGAPVTSQSRRDIFDLSLSDRRGASLKVASVVRIHKLMTLSKSETVPLGRLQPPDLERFADLLCRTYCHRPT